MRCRDYFVSSPIARSQEEDNLRNALNLSHTNGWRQAEISALQVEIQRVESEGIGRTFDWKLSKYSAMTRTTHANGSRRSAASDRAEQLHNHRGDGTRIGHKSDCDSRAKDGTRG